MCRASIGADVYRKTVSPGTDGERTAGLREEWSWWPLKAVRNVSGEGADGGRGRSKRALVAQLKRRCGRGDAGTHAAGRAGAAGGCRYVLVGRRHAVRQAGGRGFVGMQMHAHHMFAIRAMLMRMHMIVMPGGVQRGKRVVLMCRSARHGGCCSQSLDGQGKHQQREQQCLEESKHVFSLAFVRLDCRQRVTPPCQRPADMTGSSRYSHCTHSHSGNVKRRFMRFLKSASGLPAAGVRH